MTKRIPFTSEEINTICQMWKNGYTATQICKSVKTLSSRKPQTLYPILIKNGFYSPKEKNARKYSVDDSYFSKINDEHKAYWLGFMIADGFLTNSGHSTETFGMTLNSNDRYMLELFKKDLNSTYPIHDYVSKEGYKTSRLLIKSSKIYFDLQKFGLATDKSYTAIFPDYLISQELIHHIVSGFFDVYVSFQKVGKQKYRTYTLSFTGTVEVVKTIRKILNKENIKLSYRHPERNNNNATLAICGDRQIYNIGQWMYKDATIYLERKYLRFLELSKKYNCA